MSRTGRALRGLSLLAIVSLLVVTAGGVARATSVFVDDDGNIHESNIDFIASLGVTIGCDLTGPKYCPDDPVTRAEMATFLVRAFAIPPSAVDAFSDDDGNLHEPNINAIAAAGITLGCAPGNYCPNGAVTRQQMASFLVRTLGLVQFPTPVFTDVSGTHLSDVNALAGHLITLGCSADGTKFCPTDVVLRDQMASFLARAIRLGSDRAPVVVITKPAHLATIPTAFDSGTGTYRASVLFNASVTDVNGGVAVVIWTSSVNGSIGTGQVMTSILSIPSGLGSSQPIIVARATDSGGLFSLDSIQLKLLIASP